MRSERRHDSISDEENLTEDGERTGTAATLRFSLHDLKPSAHLGCPQSLGRRMDRSTRSKLSCCDVYDTRTLRVTRLSADQCFTLRSHINLESNIINT